jgi:hypothetical protein
VHQRDPTSRSPDRSSGWLLPALLILAAVLRFWSLDFGVPHLLARPDETEVVGRAVRFLTGDLNPHFFHYPSLYFYLVGAVVGVYVGGLVLGGQTLVGVLTSAAVDPSVFLVLARGLTALLGVASVAAVYALGRAVFDRRVGLWAALFLAVAPLHVRDSHFATTDVTLTLLLTLSALFLVKAYGSGSRRSYLWGGAFAGLAASTKYVGLVMPGALLVAWGMRAFERSRERAWSDRVRLALEDRGPWLFGAVMAVAFVLTSPYVLLDRGLFSSHFRFQLGHLAGGHGVDLGIGGWYHLRHTLPLAVGWPVFGVAVLGGVIAWRAGWQRIVVLLAFPVLFYASTFGSRTLFLRYMLPVVPFVCVLAGVGACAAQRYLSSRPRAVLVLLAAAVLAGPIHRSVTTNRLLGRTDSRVLAAEWLLEEAGQGTHAVYQSGAHWGHLQLPPPADSLETLRSRASRPASRPELQATRDFARLQAEARLADVRVGGVGFRSVRAVELEAGERPEWIVLLESGLIEYGRIDDAVRDVLASGYDEAHRVAGVPPEGGGWYDQHDAFYLPFTGFGDIARPGPSVTIYRRAEEPSTNVPGAESP